MKPRKLDSGRGRSPPTPRAARGPSQSRAMDTWTQTPRYSRPHLPARLAPRTTHIGVPSLPVTHPELPIRHKCTHTHRTPRPHGNASTRPVSRRFCWYGRAPHLKLSIGPSTEAPIVEARGAALDHPPFALRVRANRRAALLSPLACPLAVLGSCARARCWLWRGARLVLIAHLDADALGRGVAIEEPRSSRRDWISASCSSRRGMADDWQCSRATPMCALSSSVSPSAEKIRSSFGARSPL